MLKMEQFVMAEKGERHWEHMKQFTVKKKEDHGCQVFYPTISHRIGREHKNYKTVPTSCLEGGLV